MKKASKAETTSKKQAIKKKQQKVRPIFVGYVKNLDTKEISEISVTMSKPIEELTYDEVEIAISDKFDKKISSSDQLRTELCKVQIIDEKDPNIQWPVFREDDPKINDLQKSKTYKKYLVLPNATYSLTPECKLWMKLIEKGVLEEDSEFNFEKMHSLLEDMRMEIKDGKAKIKA